jgi:hypothetical protein
LRKEMAHKIPHPTSTIKNELGSGIDEIWIGIKLSSNIR